MKHFIKSIVPFSFIIGLCFLTACASKGDSSSVETAQFSTESSNTTSLPNSKQLSVGIIEAPWALGTSALDAAYAETLFATAEKEILVIPCFATEEQEILDYATQLIEDEVKALIVSIPTPSTADKLIEIVKKKGIPILFMGAEPTDQTMQSYDKSWYIGMLCEQTGELLGKAIAQDFKDRIIPDNNGDDLLQYAWFGGDASGSGKLHYEYSLQSATDMGVFSNEVFADLTNFGQEAGNAMAQTLFGLTEPVQQYPTPEAVIASDSETAKGAAPILQERNVYLACVAWSQTEAQSLQEQGIHVPVWFPKQEATKYAVQFAENLLQGKHVTLDTGLYLDEQRKTLIGAQTKK